MHSLYIKLVDLKVPAVLKDFLVDERTFWFLVC